MCIRDRYVNKYLTWSSYEPEEKAVMIAYGSIYGNTENAANILAGLLDVYKRQDVHQPLPVWSE